MKSATVKPMPGEGAEADQVERRRAPRACGASRRRIASSAPPASPSVLPTTRPITIASATGSEVAASIGGRVEDDAGVGQGEERQDHVARPRVQRVLQAQRRGHGLATDVDDALPRAGGRVGLGAVGRHLRQQARDLVLDGRRGWNGRAGVSRPTSTPAIVACTPLSSIANHAASPSTRYGPRWRTCARAGDHIGASRRATAGEPGQLHVVGVEDGDHGDRADVVDHRHAEQEDHQRRAARACRAPPRRRARRRCPSPSGCPSRPASAPPPTTSEDRQRRARPCRRPPRTAAAPPRGGSENSPVTSSRLTSSPMTRKKIAIRPSLTACAHALDVRPVADRERHVGAPDVLVGVRRETLAQTRAAIVATSSTTPPAISVVQEIGQRPHDEARHAWSDRAQGCAGGSRGARPRPYRTPRYGDPRVALDRAPLPRGQPFSAAAADPSTAGHASRGSSRIDGCRRMATPSPRSASAPPATRRPEWLPVVTTAKAMPRAWRWRRRRSHPFASTLDDGDADEQVPAEVQARHRGVDVGQRGRLQGPVRRRVLRHRVEQAGVQQPRWGHGQEARRSPARWRPRRRRRRAGADRPRGCRLNSQIAVTRDHGPVAPDVDPVRKVEQPAVAGASRPAARPPSDRPRRPRGAGVGARVRSRRRAGPR